MGHAGNTSFRPLRSARHIQSRMTGLSACLFILLSHFLTKILKMKGVLHRAIVTARGEFCKEDFKALRYASLVLFNVIVKDLRDESVESSWIDVVLGATSRIKRTPTLRDDMFEDIQRNRREVWNWYVEDGDGKMRHRRPTLRKDFRSLGRRNCKLKDVVISVVVKMYSIFVEYELTRDLDEEGVGLYRQLRTLRHDRDKLEGDLRQKLTELNGEYKRLTHDFNLARERGRAHNAA